MPELNDQKLISDYLDGDERSLEILIGRYLKPIYSFVYRFVGNDQDAEDITQETFVKVWRNLRKYDTKRSFKTWIFSIAKNASIDLMRKKKILPFSEFSARGGENDFAETLADPAPLPDKLFELNNMSQILNSAIEKLPSNYRAVLFLRHNDHFKFREIAEILDEPLDTVKSRLRRGLLLLKKILKDSI